MVESEGEEEEGEDEAKEGGPGTNEEGVWGKKDWRGVGEEEGGVVDRGREGGAGWRQKEASSCMKSTNSRNSITNSLSCFIFS